MNRTDVKSLIIAVALAALAGGCDEDEESKGGLPEPCATYLSSVETCIDKMPDDSKEEYQKKLKRNRHAWENAAEKSAGDELMMQGLEATCQKELDGWKKASGELGCK